jgi:hypothetical protein
MANMCYNYVVFSGEPANIKKLNQRIDEAIETEKKTQLAQQIHSHEEIIERFFFDVSKDISDETEINIMYETKWDSNILDVAKICVEFGVTANHEYNEASSYIYGSCSIDEKGNVIEDTAPTDFCDLIDYDEEKDVYIYNGDEWTFQDEIFEWEYERWKAKQPEQYWLKTYNLNDFINK